MNDIHKFATRAEAFAFADETPGLSKPWPLVRTNPVDRTQDIVVAWCVRDHRVAS